MSRLSLSAYAVLAALGLAGCEQRAPEGALVLRASQLYVAPEQPPLYDAVVLLRDGKIVEVGAADEVVTRGAAGIAGCDGGVVAAGFQNSHVHFTEEVFARAREKPADELAAGLTRMLSRYGFTTVVDATSSLTNTAALRERIETGEIPGPRILTAGDALYPRDGIPIYLRDLPPEILTSLSQPASVEDALDTVRSNLDGGADATKLFLMTPQGGGRFAFMEPEVARASTEETHRRGRLVLAHPTDLEGMNLAVEAGVDIVVHTTIGRGETTWDRALVARLLARNIAVVPTLKLWRYELARAELPPHIVDLATADAVEQLRVFSSAGGQVLFGTDVGYMSDDDPTVEYELMARVLTPMQILASLTTAPAARWSDESLRGRVAPGLEADLVVLDADPGADATGFANVRCTIRGGRLIYKRDNAAGG